MRKVLAFVLVGLAVFALALAAILRFYAPSHVKKTPLGTKVTLYGNGTGAVFNTKTSKAEPVTIRSIRHVRADSDASSGNDIVFDQGLCILIATGNTNLCPPLGDPRLISVVTERIVSDRVSGNSVSGKGSTLDAAPVEHKGLTLKFPFDAKKKTYPFWDYNVQTSRPAVYQGQDKISGLTVYRYGVTTPKTKFELLPGTSGFYSDKRTIWVEPETGLIIKADDNQTKTFANGSLAAKLHITTAPESVKHEADMAKTSRDGLHLLTGLLPLILLIVGIVLGVVGVLLLRRSGGADGRPGPAHARQEPVPAGQW